MERHLFTDSPLSIRIIPLSRLVPLGAHAKVVDVLLARLWRGDHVVHIVLRGGRRQGSNASLFSYSPVTAFGNRDGSAGSPDRCTRSDLDSNGAGSPATSQTGSLAQVAGIGR